MEHDFTALNKVKQFGYRARIYGHYATYNPVATAPRAVDGFARMLSASRHRLQKWLPVDRGAKCLDLGCGSGHVLAILGQQGYNNVTGIDISPEQVQLAKQVCTDVFEADAIDFLLAHPSEYDFITGYDIVEHFTKDELFEFLDASYGALRPGGRIVLQTPNAECPWGMAVRYGDLTHELAFSPQSLANVLGLVGFGNFEARECGPFVHGLNSFFRSLIWEMIRSGLLLWNLAECGSMGSGIYTRVFIAKADKAFR